MGNELQPLENVLLLQNNDDKSNDKLEWERDVFEDRDQASTKVRNSERHKQLPTNLSDVL